MAVLILVAALFVAPPVALKYDVPQGWVTKTPASSMRVAEFMLPRAPNDKEDAELAVFFFGGTGGSVQANIDRWLSQMAQPDGRPSKDVAKTSSLKTKSGLAIDQIDLTGTYVAEVKPGATERHNKPGFRLRAAVVDTRDGPYFVKLTGPAATVGRWEQAFAAFLQSLRIE